MAQTGKLLAKPEKKVQNFDISIDCDDSQSSRDLVGKLILFGYRVKVIHSAVSEPIVRYDARSYSGWQRICMQFFMGRKSLVDLAFSS